jgi:hypothetical protein
VTRSSLIPLLLLAGVAAAGGSCGAGNEPEVAPPDVRPDVPAEVVAVAAPASCGVTLDQVALYQGVKVLLGKGGVAVSPRNADVIADRAAVVRAFVVPVAATEVAARLTVVSAAASQVYEARRTLAAPSTDGDLASALSFDVPASALTPDAAISVELLAPETCQGEPGTRFPAAGTAPLRPLPTGTLEVQLVPFQYDSDGSGRLPDLSEAQLTRFRGLLRAMFPVADVALTVHAPVPTSIALSPQAGWSDLLDSLRELRAREAPADRVYYYGLVAPAASQSGYCTGACIDGLSYRAHGSVPATRVGVGLGYAGVAASEALAHELGHMHGRPHAPCGAVADVDRDYPYAGGGTGGWGLDERGPTLVPPAAKDIMGYCGPRWISDYTFRALAARSADVNMASAAGQALRLEDPRRWRVCLVDRAGNPHWAGRAEGTPPGTPVTARSVDAGGSASAVEVFEVEIADSEERAYWVPEPPAPGASLQLPGSEALPFPP